jgi:hypothetical protein
MLQRGSNKKRRRSIEEGTSREHLGSSFISSLVVCRAKGALSCLDHVSQTS